MTYGWHDLLGNIGVVMVLVLYFLLQSERMQATSPRVFSSECARCGAHNRVADPAVQPVCVCR